MKQLCVLLLVVFNFNNAFCLETLPPSATISGTTTVCRNAASPLITFTGSGGTAPYTFTYTISGVGGNQTVVTTSGNSVTVSAPTGTAGTFTYSLVSVADSQLPNNPITVSGSAVVTVSSPPTVDFTFTNDNTCSGTAIQFTSNVTGTGPYTYSWNFGDSTALSTQQNPSHSFVSLGCGTATFNVVLTITGNGCSVTRAYTVSVKQKPDIDFGDVSSPFDPFSNCSNASSNPVYTVTVGNNSNSTCISSFSINWGDGNSQNNISFPLSHTYSLIGAYSMVITAVGNNGCSNTKTYIIKNVSNPLGGLNSPGSTQNLCAPTSNLQFSISNWGTNSLDTTYSIDYGDGTSPLVLTQTQLVGSSYYNSTTPANSTNYPIPHVYSTSSCPASSFQVSLNVTNACGTTPFTLGNISILTKPQANFTAPPIGCVNTSILFTNTTISGYGQNCVQSSIYTWNFGDGSPTVTTPLSPPQNINHTYVNPGTYTVTLSVQNFCGTTSKTLQICIEPPLTASFTLNTNMGCIPLAITTNNTTVTTNSCAPPTYVWNVTYAAANCGTIITPIPNQTTTNATYNFTEAGIYTIKLTATNSCGSSFATQIVTVKKPPTISLTPINDFCGTANINPTIASLTSCIPTSNILTYAWSFIGGTPATANTLDPGTINYPAGGPYTVSLIVTNECGASNTATQQFSVNTAPVITTSPLSQTICSGSSTTAVNLTANPTGATFSWTAVATAGITGFTPSGTSNTIPVQTSTTTSTSPGTVTYTITPTIGTCAGVPVAYVVNVNPAPTITTQPASSTVCQGGTPTILSVALSGATGTPQYQWYSNVSPSNSGGTLIPLATNATYNPPSTTAGTFYYYCLITLPTGGCSNITSNFATVTIRPLPTITTQPIPSQNVCVGVTIPAALTVSYTGGTGTATYQWYSNTSNATTGGTLIPGATSANYTPPVYSTSGPYYYYAVVSLTGNGCGTTTSNSAQVNVFDDPTITTQPLATQTLCQGATPTTLQVVATGGNGPFSYQWYSNTNNLNSGGLLLVGATANSFVPPTGTVGTLYYYCVISQPATPGCSVTGAIAQVIINAAPTIQNQPASSTICLGGTPTVLSVTYINGVGTPSYQWYSNLSNSNTGGTPISGAINATFSPPNSPVGTVFYYCVISLPSGGGCSSITSNTANVTINAGATINLQPTPNQTLCVGASIPTPLTITYTGGTGTASYQWYSNTTPTNSGGTLIPSATNASYTPPVYITAGTYYYYAVVTLSGNGCGPIPSNVAEVIIVADPIVTTQPLLSQTVCQTATPTNLTVSVSGGITAPYSYQWYSNTSNNTTLGTPISGATNATFTPPTANVGTIYYYCIITQTTGSGCNVTSTTAAVIVNLAPTFTSQPASSTICLGGSPTVLSVTYTNGVGTPSYQWYSNTTNSTTGGTLITSATNATFTPPNTPVGTLFYYCVISLPSTGGCSSITSNTADVTINPQATITQQPLPNQSLCVGATVATPLGVTYSNGTGTASYQWYSNTSTTNTGGSLISGATSASFTPPVFTTTGTFYYYVVVTLSGNGCGPISSNVAEIIIVADPIINTQPLASQTICQNVAPTSLSVSVSGGIGATYFYQWYSNLANNTTSGTLIVGETNATLIPPTVNVGTTYYYCVITQTNGSGCNVTSAIGQVIVNLAPAIATQPISSTICIGQTPTLLSVSYTNGVGTPQYQWYSNTTNSTTGSTPIAGATATSYNSPNTIAGTTYYYCVIAFSSGGCSNITSNIVAVIINQNPVIASQNPIICSGTAFTVTPNNSGGDIVPIGTTYTWTNPTISPPGSISGANAESTPQTTISQTLINTTTSPSTVVYTVTPLSGVCAGANFTITVTVNPSISPNTTVVNSTCYASNSGSITTNITGGIPFSSGPPYIISWTGPAGFTSSASNISGLAPGVYNLTVTDFGGCPFSNSYTITEPADIVITTNLEKDITCFGAADGEIQLTITGGTTPYSYTWTKNTLPFATTEDINNLGPGVYFVSVTDANSCGPRTASFTITEPPLLVVSLVSQTNVLCFGAATGAITINTVGGTPIQISPGVFDYTYTWTGSNGFVSSNQNLTNIIAGTYNLTVTDNSGCVKNLTVTLTQPTEIIITAVTTPITCYGANNASITVTINGGNPAYQITWSNLALGLYQNNLSAGNYTINVTDATGCQKALTINIPQAPVFTTNPIVTQITCFGANNGSINLNLIGGVLPLSLVWGDGSTAGLIRNNLGPGTYSYTIVDGTPCTLTGTFTLIQPQALVLAANITNALNCNNANTGSINLLVSGGTPPFTYSWSNGAITEDLSNLPAGNYSVTVTDSRGCIKTGQYSITSPAPIVLNVTTTTITNCPAFNINQNFSAQVSGGLPPYQFNWSSGVVSGSNNQFMTTNQNGLIILTATDALGCTANYTFNVTLPILADASFDVNSIGYTNYGEFSIIDPIQFTNTAVGDFTSILWDFGDGTFSNEENPIHSYLIEGSYVVTQTVTYPYGCTYTHIITLVVKKGYLLVVPTAFTPNRDNLNDNFRPVTKALKDVQMDIYDTWGSLIYSEMGDVLTGWDAKIKGINAENGNYYCKVSGKTFYGTIVYENHTFVLIK